MLRPNFLGVGAHKAGTTWLSEVLRAHPEVFMAHGKELLFFNRNFDKGLDWYLSHFRGAEDKRAIGEFSVPYLDHQEGIAQRIFEFDPDLKLIAILRDPVERAYSHYRWLLQAGKDHKSFLGAVEENPAILQRSLYGRCLSHYYRRFPAEQILVLNYADITKDPDGLQERVFAFLGVDTKFRAPQAQSVIGKTIKPKSQSLEKLRRAVFHWAKRNRLGFIITWFKATGLSNFYRRINNRTQREPQLSQQERESFYALLEADLDELESMVDFDIAAWRLTGRNRSPSP